jgi:SAM-dependent methyltransferase
MQDPEYLRGVQYRDAGRLSRRADLHTHFSTAEVSWFDWVIERVAVQPGLRVLELGCGPGWLWDRPAPWEGGGVELVLTDLSQGMVDAALARLHASGRASSVEGQQADARRLPFGDRTFDRVVANHMLYHLPDPADGVAEAVRVLRDDGVFVAATNGPAHMVELRTLAIEVFHELPDRPVFERSGPENGFAVLRQYFGDVHWLQYRDELRCTDPDAVLAQLCSKPPGESATQSQLSELRSAIEREFVRQDGVMTIAKDVGCFVCSGVLRSD